MLVKSFPDTSFGLTYIDGRVLITQVTDNFVHHIFCVTASGQSRFTGGNRKTPKRDVLTLFSVTRVPKSDIALKGLSTSFLHTRNALRLVLAKCSAVFFKIIKRNAEYNV